jgi:hypothetical protein
MDAKELRIGNWVINKTYPKEEQIECVQGFFDQYPVLLINSQPQETIEPIPITPEILEKAGFKQSIELVGGFLYCEDKSEEDFDIALIDGIATLQVESCNYGKPFKYLHQLQNIFYALTGEELQINLSE